MLPIKLRIEKACHTAISRIATLPHKYPLHALAKRSAKGRVKRHRSPLHVLTNIFGIDPSIIEKIPPVRVHPNRKSSRSVQIDIPANKEDSKRADANATEKIRIYSDGSAHDGKVGAAALLRREGKPDRTLQFHLGSTKHHTVYEAELVGMVMGSVVPVREVIRPWGSATASDCDYSHACLNRQIVLPHIRVRVA